MKKAFIILSLSVLIAGGTWAEDAALTEQEYKDLENLRHKVVRMKRELDTFMKEIMAASATEGHSFTEGLPGEMKVDLTESADSFIVKADLPGMGKDKINIVLENGRNLTISGIREASQEKSSPGFVKQERMRGEFKRTLELPGEGLNTGIKATYKDGVLEIIIPKKKVSKEDKVHIKVQ